MRLFHGLSLFSLAASELYDGGCNQPNSPVKLRIGNGGAGQSGLIRALATKFIQFETNGCRNAPFQIEWVKGDTTETILNLKSGAADIGITYNTAAELLAIDDGTAWGCSLCHVCARCRQNEPPARDFCGAKGQCECCENCDARPCYLFRDHFYLVGPPENLNPAGLDKYHDDTVKMVAKLYSAAENDTVANSPLPVRFLTRYDKSATNILDSDLWIRIGQTPWANPAAKWYHQYSMYPVQALEAAIKLREYTVTDRGTHLTLRSQNQGLVDNGLAVYKSGEDDKTLLNEGHVIVGRKARDLNMAWRFVSWMNSWAGQSAIVNFHKGDGVCLYKGFPNVQEVQPTECRFVPGGSRSMDGGVDVDVDEERVELK